MGYKTKRTAIILYYNIFLSIFVIIIVTTDISTSTSSTLVGPGSDI